MRDRQSDAHPVEHKPVHSVLPGEWAELHDLFLRVQASNCLKVAANNIGGLLKGKGDLGSSVEMPPHWQPLCPSDLLLARAASNGARRSTDILMRKVVAFGLRNIARDCADLSQLFGLLDHLYLSPGLGWQDWLVPDHLTLKPNDRQPVSMDPWHIQTLSLTTRQLLGLFRFFSGDGVLVTGKYGWDARTRLVCDLPPLAPLTYALIGSHAELVSCVEWNRLTEFRNRVIHQAQAQREVDLLMGRS